MEKRFCTFIRLVYIVILGASLLILSAVAENGETEMSRVLIANRQSVPEITQPLAAAYTAAVGGCAAFAAALREYGT